MRYSLFLLATVALILSSCSGNKKDMNNKETETQDSTDHLKSQEEANKYWTEKFADLRIHRYYAESWDNLNEDQKKLLYYLHEAALSGRDMIWDQNYKHNLRVRKTLEQIFKNYKGDRETENWKNFEVYAKRVFVSNGIHHHYSENKLKPEFDFAYLTELVENSPEANWPVLEGETSAELLALLEPVIFNMEFDAKRVSKDGSADLIQASAINFYGENVTQEDVEQFYAGQKVKGDTTPVEHGHNSKLVKTANGLEEKVWKVGGMYTESIEKVVYWLRKAVTLAENETQKLAFEKLIKFYESGNLEHWDDYNTTWVTDTNSVVDVINGFIEVYGDPLGYKATFESVVSIKDFEASKRMQTVSKNAQWFEDHSPLIEKHKKKNVTGISYKVIEAVVEGGDCNPTTPIGINLPNSDWIRKYHGSKSVSLGNIILAYDKASGGGLLQEFAHDSAEIARTKAHGELASKLHTALHEVVGHASGQLEDGVGTPKETLKNYASTLEEGRADLVALYFILDEKLIELGLMESLDVGKAEYDSYIRNGLMTQLRRIEPGEVIEEDHMRNRQMVAGWAYERGKADNVISKITKDGKTYFEINDYEALREIFGELLREVQRIKSTGDYEAGKKLVEDYGVKVDKALHEEVLKRSEALDLPAYGAFINPRIVPEGDKANPSSVSIEYPSDFLKQMLYYGEKYATLPIEN